MCHDCECHAGCVVLGILFNGLTVLAKLPSTKSSDILIVSGDGKRCRSTEPRCFHGREELLNGELSMSKNIASNESLRLASLQEWRTMVTTNNTVVSVVLFNTRTSTIPGGQ